MDLFPDCDDFGTPCFLIESSQVEDLNKMEDPLFLSLMTDKTKSEMYTDVIDRRTAQISTDLQILNALGSSRKDNQGNSNNNNNTHDNDNQQSEGRSLGQAQTSTSRSGGIGGGDGGDDSDEIPVNNNRTEPDVCNESTDHSEDSTSSIPELIPAQKVQQNVQDLKKDHNINVSSSSDSGKSTCNSTSSTEPLGQVTTSSQASTALADEIYQSRLEGSDDGLMPQMKTKTTSSSSMGRSKSDTSSSSVYPTSIASSMSASSLSSDATPSPHQPVLGTVPEDIEEREEEDVCSQDLFVDKEDSNAMSSQDVSRISTPRDRSTPVESLRQRPGSLYKQTLKRTSTPLLGSQDLQTPPSHEPFNCLQLSGSSSSDYQRAGTSHGSFLEAPSITPSSPTEQDSRYTPVTTESSSSDNVVSPSQSSFQGRPTTISETPENSSSKSSSYGGVISSINQQSFQCTTTKSSSSSDSFISMRSKSDIGGRSIISETSDESNYSSINPQHKRSVITSSTLDSANQSKDPVTYRNSNADEDEFVGIPEWQKDLLDKHKHLSTSSQSSPEDQKDWSLSDKNDGVPQHVSELQHSQSISTSNGAKNMTFLLKKPELSDDLFYATTMNSQDESINTDEKIPKVSSHNEQEQEENAFDLHLTQSQGCNSPTYPKLDDEIVSDGMTDNTIHRCQRTANTSSVVVIISESTGKVKAQQEIGSQVSEQAYKSLSHHLPQETPLTNEKEINFIKKSSKEAQKHNKKTEIVPALTPQISTESSTGFHFSLPPTIGEVLVASTTTPPPVSKVDAPEGESLHDTSGPPDSNVDVPSHHLPSLRYSMPIQENSDSELISIEINQPVPSAAELPPAHQIAEVSVFQRALQETKRQKEKSQLMEDTDPFLFTSQDMATGPPVAKRKKRQSSRDNNEAPKTQSHHQAEISSRSSFVNTITIKTYTTVTTQVKRVHTIVTTREGTDEVVETVEYEVKDDPFINEKVDEKVTVERIIESGNCSYQRKPKALPVEILPRVSPRTRRYAEKKGDSSTRKRKLVETQQEEKKAPAQEEYENEQLTVVIPAPPENVVEVSAPKRPPPIPNNTRVFARWSDGYYYPGVVLRLAEFSNGRCYEVRFDDGDSRKVRPEQIVVCDSLESGQRVLAQGSQGFFDPGTIVERFSTPTGTGYEIELDETHHRKRYLKQFVILSEEQVMHMTKKRSENRGQTCELVKFSSSFTSSGSVKSRDTSAKDTSGNETPKSSRKVKRRGRKRKGQSSGGTSSEGSSEPTTNKKPKRVRRDILKKSSEPTRTSPRKKSRESVPSNDTIFAGFAFLVTRSQNMSDSEGAVEDFDRKEIEQRIIAGGGVILKDFSETQNTVADKCFLISNSYCRTVKYFQCLANGIPLVSHVWIHDSVLSNHLKDYNKYLLPAGRSLETNQIVECKPSSDRMLRELNVYVHGSATFKTTWYSVLTAAGANVVTKLPNRPCRAAQLNDDLCNIVISEDTSLPQSLQYTCELLGIPIVSLEWLLQCLINGSVVHVEGHAMYNYKHTDDNTDVM